MEDHYETYSLGNFELKSGRTLPNAHLAYRTFGEPTSPAVIYVTGYGGRIKDNFWLIGEDKTLNPKDYYIIVIPLFGNGQCSSPSNMPDVRPFPKITIYDNVRAQHQLVTQGLGIKHALAVIGWSMGAAQTFQWCVQYPDFADVAAPWCGSAKTSLHNQVFLEGVKSALLSAKGTHSGGICAGEATPDSEYRGWSKAERENGLKALARVYAGWGLSQTFYRQKLYETHPNLKFKNLEDFMVGFWEAWALTKDPENMMCMLHTWQSSDVSNQEPFNGDFEKALASIKTKTFVMPGRTDLYFPPEDSEYEVECMSPGVGELRVFESIWGHWAGGPGTNPDDANFLDDQLRELFKHGGVNA